MHVVGYSALIGPEFNFPQRIEYLSGARPFDRLIEILNHRLVTRSGSSLLRKAKFQLYHTNFIYSFVLSFHIYLSLSSGAETDSCSAILLSLTISPFPMFLLVHRTVSLIYGAVKSWMQFLTHIVASILSIFVMMPGRSSCLFQI